MINKFDQWINKKSVVHGVRHRRILSSVTIMRYCRITQSNKQVNYKQEERIYRKTDNLESVRHITDCDISYPSFS